MSWAIWPWPRMRIMIQHSRHNILLSLSRCTEFGTFCIVVMGHTQAKSVGKYASHNFCKIISMFCVFSSSYTCPSSWAIVNAADNPLSWTTAHDARLHIVFNSARPNVSHFCSLALRHICSLKIWMKFGFRFIWLGHMGISSVERNSFVKNLLKCFTEAGEAFELFFCVNLILTLTLSIAVQYHNVNYLIERICRN